MSKYPKHDKLLVAARAELGTHENPMGSNTGSRVRQYQAATWLGGTNWPWCAAFCCFVAKEAGFNLAYRGAGAYEWYDTGAAHVGQKIPAGQHSKVVPGDFVVFKLGQGHIGVVERIEDGYVHSVDGNVSDSVDRRARLLDSVYGFVHLDEKASKAAPPKPPTFEVVTGLNGQVVYVSGAKAIAEHLEAFLKKHPKGVVVRPRKAH